MTIKNTPIIIWDFPNNLPEVPNMDKTTIKRLDELEKHLLLPEGTKHYVFDCGDLYGTPFVIEVDWTEAEYEEFNRKCALIYGDKNQN